MSHTVYVFPDAEALTKALSRYLDHVSTVAPTLSASTPVTDNFSVAVAGGSLPQLAGKALARLGTGKDWPKWHLFLADERCVPQDHADSNIRAIRAEMLPIGSVPTVPVWHGLKTDSQPTPSKCMRWTTIWQGNRRKRPRRISEHWKPILERNTSPPLSISCCWGWARMVCPSL